MKIIVSDLVITQRWVDIPDVCPNCGADFHEPNLVVENCETVIDSAFLDKDSLDYAEDRQLADGGELVATLSVLCEECEHVLAKGTRREVGP